MNPYKVEPNPMDAARPFKVVAMYRKFNRVVGFYETKVGANRACNYRNRVSAIKPSEVARYRESAQ